MTLELLGKSCALWLLGSWLRTLPLLLVLQVVDRLLAGARRHELRAVGWWALLVAAVGGRAGADAAAGRSHTL